jgi:mRNA interferase RelE/StbE
MSYHIEFVKQAAKQFKALPPQEQKRIQPKIDALATEPRPEGVVKLKGEENLYRIRVNDILERQRFSLGIEGSCFCLCHNLDH